jgi:hypothetical protein
MPDCDRCISADVRSAGPFKQILLPQVLRRLLLRWQPPRNKSCRMGISLPGQMGVKREFTQLLPLFRLQNHSLDILAARQMSVRGTCRVTGLTGLKMTNDLMNSLQISLFEARSASSSLLLR